MKIIEFDQSEPKNILLYYKSHQISDEIKNKYDIIIKFDNKEALQDNLSEFGCFDPHSPLYGEYNLYLAIDTIPTDSVDDIIRLVTRHRIDDYWGYEDLSVIRTWECTFTRLVEV